ncbi:hypothetical protein M501DRAFT_278101 [Patellaria atrata CBS 101060]|uniref:Uncharacterized protein n=1 Tax=Patellaria atrata CBS 101060 TaxID=1346257 RepID=A0A9P4S4H0_9PEZI|nr:hypothetical protein M501DRAFT_278101 [Patellaria atrata CBS 101060]
MKTYSSAHSLVVTHPTTTAPIQGLSMAERTGCPIVYGSYSHRDACVIWFFISKKRDFIKLSILEITLALI